MVAWPSLTLLHRSNDNGPSIPSDKSLYDFFNDKRYRDRWAKTSDHLGLEEAKRREVMLLRLAESWGAFIGSPVQKQSLRFMWMEQCLEGENLFVAETYAKVLARLARITEHVHLCLNTKVTAISEPQDGAARNKVWVDTRHVLEGKQLVHAFDEVIVTVPLGYLKKHKTLCNPPLPERMDQAIDALGYGCLDKVGIYDKQRRSGSGMVGVCLLTQASRRYT